MNASPLRSAQKHPHAAAARRFRVITAAFWVGAMIAMCSGLTALRPARCTTEPVAAERINPNTAPTASLMRLPGIGRTRAMDIVEFRQSRPTGQPVFRNAADLQQIRGIGPVTAEKIAPYLTFEFEF
jgi:DNA uptake protein ComE-like DNA-binding protein